NGWRTAFATLQEAAIIIRRLSHDRSDESYRYFVSALTTISTLVLMSLSPRAWAAVSGLSSTEINGKPFARAKPLTRSAILKVANDFLSSSLIPRDTLRSV